METQRIAIIGAGIGGLVAAIDLSRQGFEVAVYEKAHNPGGKMRQIKVAGAHIDSGPTVLTMRWVFENIFADAGSSLDDYITTQPLDILARHSWKDGQQLDLYADMEKSVDAIGHFSGAQDAYGFRHFAEEAARIYQTLEQNFILTAQPTLPALIKSAGFQGLIDLWRTKPFISLWNALGRYFHDPRLQQLFGRYSTYVGSSPFQAPGTLMLVAHVELQGVWHIQGGMFSLAKALQKLAEGLGVSFHFGQEVSQITLNQRGRIKTVKLASGEEFETNVIIVNGDIAAISNGLFGPSIRKATPRISTSERSLSAMTWSLNAKTSGFPLSHHNVFFSSDYPAEFHDILDYRRLPTEPTVYIYAQDRMDNNTASKNGQSTNGTIHDDPERLFCIVNAPADGDKEELSLSMIEHYQNLFFSQLGQHGLSIEPVATGSRITTPSEFNQLFPATGGALYGRATHGWRASFNRPYAKTKIPGLYLTGGSTHPGPGVPMAAISGRLAAASVMSDRHKL